MTVTSRAGRFAPQRADRSRGRGNSDADASAAGCEGSIRGEQGKPFRVLLVLALVISVPITAFLLVRWLIGVVRLAYWPQLHLWLSIVPAATSALAVAAIGVWKARGLTSGVKALVCLAFAVACLVALATACAIWFVVSWTL